MKRGSFIWVAVLAVLISLPAWRLPLLGDDLVMGGKLAVSHPIKAQGYFTDSHRFGPALMTLFDWFHPGLTRRVMEYGVLPWWTAEDARQTFWRPLAAATHWFDYTLWPGNSSLMHVHNAFWFAAFLMAAWAFYREMAGKTWEAILALLMLALNQENWQPISWVASRNTLMTLFFVLMTLILYRRAARRGNPALFAGAWTAFAAALLSGEGGVIASGYLLGHALFLERDSWKARVVRLLPFIMVAAVWRAVYKAGGFGAGFSGLYLDPGADPARFLRNLVEWAPVLAANTFTAPILGKYASLAPALRPWAWGVAAAAAVAFLLAYVPLIGTNRKARFWVFGMLAAAVPACATAVPDNRLSLYLAIGFFPLAARFTRGLAFGEEWAPRKPAFRLAGCGFVFLLAAFHLLLPLPGHAKRLAYVVRPPTDVPVETALRAGPAEVLILVNPPDPMGLSYLPYFLIRDGLPIPGRMRLLSSAAGDTIVRRTGADSLTLISDAGPLMPARIRTEDLPAGAPRMNGFYLNRQIGAAFRPDSLPFRTGDQIRLSGLTVTVGRVDRRGLPLEAGFLFDHPLDDPSYRWVFWDSRTGHYASFPLPAVGEERLLKGPLPPG